MKLVITRTVKGDSLAIVARLDMPYEEVWVKNGNAAKKICRRIERELSIAITDQQTISFEIEAEG